MKKFILKNAMALVALAIAGMTLMSMSLTNGENKLLEDDWYEFTGDDPENGNDYDFLGDSPDGCETGNAVCAIRPLELDNEGNPVIDQAMIELIDEALSQQSSTPHVKVKYPNP